MGVVVVLGRRRSCPVQWSPVPDALVQVSTIPQGVHEPLYSPGKHFISSSQTLTVIVSELIAQMEKKGRASLVPQ